MKFAFMSFSCPELTLEEMVRAAVRFGYDGIEPRMEAGHRHGIELSSGPEQRREFRRQAQDLGVEIACLATSRRYADPATASSEVDQTLRCIDLAGEIGASRLRVFGGTIPAEVSRSAAADSVTGALLLVAKHAADRAVTVCLETHDDWKNPEDVATVMRRVNQSSIAVNLDFLHPLWGHGVSVEDSFATLRPWIDHVHLHDAVWEDGHLELVCIGEGNVDHRTPIHLLQQSNYTGFLSGEWIDRSPGWEEHLPREIKSLRQYAGEDRS